MDIITGIVFAGFIIAFAIWATWGNDD